MDYAKHLSSLPDLLQELLCGDIDREEKPQTSTTSGETARKFEIVVGADDPRIAIFGACCSAQMLANFLHQNPGEDDLTLPFQFAEMIRMFPEIKGEIGKVAYCLGECIENIVAAIAHMDEHNLLG
jgi:hypothetical protein